MGHPHKAPETSSFDHALTSSNTIHVSEPPTHESSSRLMEGSADSLDSARPPDDAILEQENAIRAEVAQKLELVGDKEPMSVLMAEYERGNPVFGTKIKKLEESYAAIRRARGDGNCFFRSFLFAYLNYLLESQDLPEAVRLAARIRQCREVLISMGFAEFTWEDFVNTFTEQIDSCLGEDCISTEALVESCRDPFVSNYSVMFFRFVTSSEIQYRADFYAPFVLGVSDMDVVKFCRTSVEPMGEESDHIHITALTDALEVPVRVVYLDGSTSGTDSAELNHHDFIPEKIRAQRSLNTADWPSPYVVLLYRPGHYDILYPKK